MRQLEGYSSITPIAIDDTSDLRKQVDQLYPGDIALFGTDRLGVPLDYIYIGLDPREDYSEGRRNSINEVGFYDANIILLGRTSHNPTLGNQAISYTTRSVERY